MSRTFAAVVVVGGMLVANGHSYVGSRTAVGTPFVPAGIQVDVTASKPNVLIFLIDDMGYSDLGVFGRKNVSTPHIDALVHSGAKFTQWISAAPICTPSRAAFQTGRYPIRTGCMGDTVKYRVIPTPSNPGGLNPDEHMSLATALKQAGYHTGMSGKWHLGINSADQDRKFMPNAHSYDTYLGAPFTNAPMCAMDADGISKKEAVGPIFCFLTANDTVVEQPLRIQNFTKTITDHALHFIDRQSSEEPWYFLMAYFHVHTPLFTNKTNQGRSQGGKFGDNVEELDDSVGEIMAMLRSKQMDSNTLIFLTSDNGPYQEEGWENCGRSTLYGLDGSVVGRLRGGKGQVFEGGIRMPGAVVWPGIVRGGFISDTMVSTMDIFPTVLAAAGVSLPPSYTIDGKDMTPVLREKTNQSMHEVFFHYCGFNLIAARVNGRFKVFWATQKWYTNDAQNTSVCLECCNGVVPASKLFTPATELCSCTNGTSLVWHTENPIIYDMKHDRGELDAIGNNTWPRDTNITMSMVMTTANTARNTMITSVHPTPKSGEAGSCTAGIPAASRQPCCTGCKQLLPVWGLCKNDLNTCECGQP